jgi:PAS domain S-box-containing protein
MPPPPPRSDDVGLPQVPPLSQDDARLLIESVIDYAIFMLSAEGYVATWNIGAEKIKGYKASEIIGEHFSKFYLAEDIAAGKPQRELELATEFGRVEDEGWRLRKDGSRFWGSVIITALRDEHGNLRGFGKVTRDLTARRLADDELRRAEHRFHHLVDAVIDYAIFMLDPKGFVSTWNSGATRVKGYAPEEIIGSHFSVFYTAEDRASGKPEAILDAVRREGRYEEESWRVRKDGSRFWANVVITALRGDDGALLGFAKVTRDLTGRRTAEDEIRGSEERFRLLVESVGDYAIYILDTEGRITTWNLGAQRMKGFRAEEVLGKNFSIFFPAEAVASGKPWAELAAARAQGRHEDEGWRIKKGGTRFWANAILTALHDAHGTLIGFAKVTRDLTSRREAEETERRLLREQTAREIAQESEQRIRESEARYRSLSQRLEIVFEGVADSITVQDHAGHVIFANRAAATSSGFASVDEMMNTPPDAIASNFEMFDEQGQPFRYENLPGRRVMAGEPSNGAMLHVRDRRTGRDWWSFVRASAVIGADGKPELAINIWHDVTSQHRQERQAKYLADVTAALATSLQHDEMLSTLASVLVPGIADWCSIYLLEGDELRNVAVAHVDPAKLAIARAYHERFPPDPRQPRGIWNVLRTGESEVINEVTDEMLVGAARDPEHLAILRSVGMRSALIAPIRAHSRTLGVISLVGAENHRHYDEMQVALAEELGRRAGVALDNAQLYRAAQEAAKSAEEASRAKDEFLATVSHELRTPLSAILGWSTLLKDRVTDPAVARPISVIHRNAQAQVRIIDDILDVSRVITGKLRLEPKPADLVAITREAIEVVSPSAIAKKIEIAFSPQEEFCLLVADPERLQQVVWNLLSNAVKFTDPAGSIQIALRQEGPSVILSVTDTGKGIEAAFLPFVFERFKQADSSITRRVGGLGLGLALVRHIAELHGGQVAAASDGPDKGATFTLTLPIRAVIPAATERPPRTAASASALPRTTVLDGVRVLVVDDEPDARDLIAAVLTDAGAVVETASSASEGFGAIARFHPDVVVSDIGMPDEDGFSLMRRIRTLPAAEGGRLPSLALTAFAREEDRTRAIAAGYTTHIGKPVDPDALASAVANLAAVTRPL